MENKEILFRGAFNSQTIYNTGDVFQIKDGSGKMVYVQVTDTEEGVKEKAAINKLLNPIIYPNTTLDGLFAMTLREYYIGCALQGHMANSVPGPHHEPRFASGEILHAVDYLLEEMSKEEHGKL